MHNFTLSLDTETYKLSTTLIWNTICND